MTISMLGETFDNGDKHIQDAVELSSFKPKLEIRFQTTSIRFAKMKDLDTVWKNIRELEKNKWGHLEHHSCTVEHHFWSDIVQDVQQDGEVWNWI